MTKLSAQEKRAAWKRAGMRNPPKTSPTKREKPAASDGMTSTARAYLVVINRYAAGVSGRKARS